MSILSFTACGGVVTSLNDVIQSPNYPNDYPNSVTCVWEVLIPGKRIGLEFDYFQTQSSYDYINIYKSVSTFNGKCIKRIENIKLRWHDFYSPTIL